MLARINPFATKKRRENTFYFLNIISMALTTYSKAGTVESSDTAENLLAATRIANLISFALPYIERMIESQVVEGARQRTTNHLYTALVAAAAAVTGASWGLAIGVIEISLTGAAAAMKLVAKLAPEDRIVPELFKHLELLVPASKADETPMQKTYADGVKDASHLVRIALKANHPSSTQIRSIAGKYHTATAISAATESRLSQENKYLEKH